MYGAMVQMPNVLKNRVVSTQKKSRSLNGASVARSCGILAPATTATAIAAMPTTATANHQNDSGVNNTNSRAASATTNATPATATVVGTWTRTAERTRCSGASGIAASENMNEPAVTHV